MVNARLRSLKVSLLASLGLLPLACGGVSEKEPAGASPGGAGGATATGGGGGSGGTKTLSAVCTSPVLDTQTGLVSCAEGYSHRPSATSCEVREDSGKTGSGIPKRPRAPQDEAVRCADDPTVCDVYDLGYCASDEPLAAPWCWSGCREDSDCGAGFICHCSTQTTSHGGECVPSDCQVDDDCGPSSLCLSGYGICTGLAFACFKASDSCLTGDDCSGATCALERGQRSCFSGACGRPFVIDYSARLASVVTRSDWTWGDVRPATSHLTPAERAAQAESWAARGQMEHASIAAFARFQLQLLALGAPPALVEACNQALLDETLHARLCFALASAYAGRSLGPGALDVTGSLDAASMPDVLDLVLLEGCFGETSAALEAAEGEQLEADPVVRGVYARIAEDELRHAELAFQFVRWALEAGGQAARERVVSAIEHPPRTSASDVGVTVPCLEALLRGRQNEGASDSESELAPQRVMLAN